MYHITWIDAVRSKYKKKTKKYRRRWQIWNNRDLFNLFGEYELWNKIIIIVQCHMILKCVGTIKTFNLYLIKLLDVRFQIDGKTIIIVITILNRKFVLKIPLYSLWFINYMPYKIVQYWATYNQLVDFNQVTRTRIDEIIINDSVVLVNRSVWNILAKVWKHKWILKYLQIENNGRLVVSIVYFIVWNKH